MILASCIEPAISLSSVHLRGSPGTYPLQIPGNLLTVIAVGIAWDARFAQLSPFNHLRIRGWITDEFYASTAYAGGDECMHGYTSYT